MGFIRKTGMREMLNQEVILFHLEQAYYGGYATADLRPGCFRLTFYCLNSKIVKFPRKNKKSKLGKSEWIF